MAANKSNKQQVQVLGKQYDVDIPSYIYPEYFAFMDEPDTTPQDMADFLIALREYTRGNFDFVSQNKYIRAELRQVRMQMKIRHEKYIAKYIQQKEAASRGGQKTHEKMQNTVAETVAVANATANATANGQVEKEKEKENEKSTPIAPVEAGTASGGDCFKFLGLLGFYRQQVEAVKQWQMPAGCDEALIDRVAWCCTDPGLRRKIAKAQTADQVREACRTAPSGAWSRQQWQCCAAVESVTAHDLANVGGCNSVDQFQQAVAHEINTKRLKEGTGIFSTIIEKIEDIKQGTAVSNLSAWLAARKPSKK